MKKPSVSTMVLGHPVVTVPTMIGGLGLLYVCSLGGADGILPGIPVAAFMAAAAKANEQVTAYKQWVCEWNAMLPPAERPPSRRDLHWGMALSIFLCLGWLLFSTLGPHGKSVMIGFGLLMAMAVGGFFILRGLLRGLLRRLRRRGARASAVKPVAIVARPVLPVPTLAAAYAALPGYCQHLLASAKP